MRLIKGRFSVPKYSLTVSARATQEGYIALGKSVTNVGNATQQTEAVNVGQELRRYLNEVEKLRKQLVSSPLEAQRIINGLSKQHCEPIKAQLDRIEFLVNKFQEAEAERVRQEEEAQRLEFEETQKQLTEQAASGDEFMQELVAYRNEQALDALRTAPAIEPVKARGAATRKVLKWECTDIHALYAARPDLCNGPTPRASAIQEFCSPEIIIPGLKLEWVTETTIRSR